MSGPPDRHDLRLAGILGVGALALYAFTLDRGFGGGDVAEMQMSAISLGICHPPGYALQSFVAHLFTWLPFGTPPMRVNLLSAVSAATCVGLLYGVLRHLEISRAAAAAGMLTLAVSDLFWRHARYAEVYAFHTMLVAAVMFCGVRYIATRHRGWLTAEFAVLGFAASARPSVALLMPALVLFHAIERRTRTGGFTRKAEPGVSRAGRMLPQVVAFALPFLLTFAYFVWRDRPETRFNYLAFKPDLRPFIESSDGNWLPDNDSLWHRARRAAWIMSVGPFRRCISPGGFELETGLTYYVQRFIASELSAAAALLIPLGIWRWRRRPAALGLTLAAWAGNFALYSTYASADRITFTLPGLAALAMLLSAGLDQWRLWSPPVARALLIAPAAALFVHNYPLNDASNPARLAEKIDALLPEPLLVLDPVLPRYSTLRAVQAPPPPNARIFAYFGLARALEYHLHFELDRLDVEIVGHDDPRVWHAFAEAVNDGRPMFAWLDEGLVPWPP